MVKTYSWKSITMPWRCGKIFAVNHKSDEVRYSSSSGGMFYALAQWVIKQGGTVIGAAYEGTEVKHVAINNVEEISRLQKSKYAQSSLAGNDVKEALSLADKRWILFSGTPCQVMAVKQKYGQSRKLLTVEIACHGVPTVESYRSFIADNDVRSIDFRNKRKGWKNYEVEIIHNDDTVTYHKPLDIPFFQRYMNGEYIQKRCFTCNAKYFNSKADFTISDFWGVNEFCPELNDDKGSSLVFLHGKKAHKVWDHVSSQFEVRSVSLQQAICYNSGIVRPIKSELLFVEKIYSWRILFLQIIFGLLKSIR